MRKEKKQEKRKRVSCIAWWSSFLCDFVEDEFVSGISLVRCAETPWLSIALVGVLQEYEHELAIELLDRY